MNVHRTVPQLLADLWNRPEIRLAGYLLLLTLVVFLVWHLTPVLALIGVAYALAYVVSPFLTWLEGRRIKRLWGVLLLLLAAIGFFALLFWRLVTEASNFILSLPDLTQQLSGMLDKMPQPPGELPLIQALQYNLVKYLQAQAQTLAQNIGPVLEHLLFARPSIVRQTLWILTQAGLVLTLTLYFALDYDRIGAGVLRLVPEGRQPAFRRFSEDISNSFGKSLRGLLLTALAVGVLASAGLVLLGVPNPLVLGLLSGLFYPVPFVGMLLASLLPLLQAVPEGGMRVAQVAALYFLLNQVAGNVLGPLIIGRTTRILPATLLVAVLIGLGLAGTWGVLLAGPAALLLRCWTERYWLGSLPHQSRTARPTSRNQRRAQDNGASAEKPQ